MKNTVALIIALTWIPAVAAAKPKLAVMPIADKTQTLNPSLVENLTETLRVEFARQGYIVIDKTRQAAALKKLVKKAKKASYHACVDEACQIPLGQALAADTLVRAQIARIGSRYVLSAELVSLAKEAIVSAANEKITVKPSATRDDRLLNAITTLAETLRNKQAGFTPKKVKRAATPATKPAARPATKPQRTPVQKPAKPPVRSARRSTSPRPSTNRPVRRRSDRFQSSTLFYLTSVVAGAGLIVGGAAFVAYGVNAGRANNAETPEDLKSLSDKADRSLIAGGVLAGVGVLATGAAILIYRMEKKAWSERQRAVGISNVAFSPTRGGIAVGIGGRF